MKKIFTTITLFLVINCYVKSQNTFPSSGSAGIGTTSPNASALLEVKSTKKGVLIPRMTTAQRNTIVRPVQGLLIFQTDGTAGFYYYNSGWKAISSSTSGFAKTDLSNLAATTSINANLLPVNNTKNFGSKTKTWKKGFFNDTVFTKSLVATDSLYVGVKAYGGSYGVYAYSKNNYGVYGNSGYLGIYGSGGTYGVYGSSSSYGVYGSGNYGVYGSGTTYGIYGSSYAVTSSAVYGQGSYAFGVTGNSTYNYGGYFTSTYLHGLYAKTSNSDPSAYAAVFQGNTFSYGSYLTSDERVKKNISDFKSGMAVINQLKPKNYEFRNDGKYANLNLPKGNHFGLLAQDVEKLFPGLVREAPLEVENTTVNITSQKNNPDTPNHSALQMQSPKRAETMQVKAINYIELIPVMIKGMQELDAENKDLKKQVSDMQDEVTQLKQLVQNLSVKMNGVSAVSLSNASLQQNQPNPFAGKTIIPLSVPANAKNALLTITETGSGKVLKTMTVAAGLKQISVDAGVLSNGAYTYTLTVDGKKIDSRQMTILK